MNKIEKVKAVKSHVGEEFEKFLQANDFVKEMDDVSASANQELRDSVVNLLSGFTSSPHKLTQELANGIVKKADAELAKGMDGEGTYFLP